MVRVVAMQELVKLQWQPGQDIVASIALTQLPKEVQNRIKGTVTSVNEDLDQADAFKLIAEIRKHSQRKDCSQRAD